MIKMIVFTFGYMIVIVLLTTVGAISDAEKSVISSQVMTAALQCITDHPLKISDIEAFKMHTIPNDMNSKCFAACMFKKVGIMDDMGMLSPAEARKSAEQVFKGNEEYLKNVDKIMDLCSKVNKENVMDGNKGCDRAKLVHACLMENAPKYGFEFEF